MKKNERGRIVVQEVENWINAVKTLKEITRKDESEKVRDLYCTDQENVFWASSSELAKLLRKSTRYITDAIRRGAILGKKIGARYYIPLDDPKAVRAIEAERRKKKLKRCFRRKNEIITLNVSIPDNPYIEMLVTKTFEAIKDGNISETLGVIPQKRLMITLPSEKYRQIKFVARKTPFWLRCIWLGTLQ
jgi:hypothetical protein